MLLTKMFFFCSTNPTIDGFLHYRSDVGCVAMGLLMVLMFTQALSMHVISYASNIMLIQRYKEHFL